MICEVITCYLNSVSASALVGALVYRTSNATVAANADIPFQSENYDSNNYFTVGTSAADFVIPATGLYRAQMNVATSSSAGGVEGVKSYKNGSGLLGGHSAAPQKNAGLSWGNGASGVLALTAADTIKIQNAFNSISYGYNVDSRYTWHAIEPLDALTQYALVYPSANISITSGSWQTLGYDSEVADTSGIHSTVTNNSRLTVPSGFTARGRLSWGVVTSNTNFSITVSVAKNGSANFTGAPIRSKGSSGNKLMSGVGPPVNVSAADYFEHQTYSNVNGSIINDPYTWFCLESVPASIVACIAKKTTTQNITTSASDVTFDANEYDDASIHSTSSNTNRFVVPAGCTKARFHFGCDPNSSSGLVSAEVKLNGGTITGGTASESTVAVYGSLGLSTPWLSVVPGDIFTIPMVTSSGTVVIGTKTWAALECE